MAKGRYSKYLDVFLFSGDLIALNVAFLVAYYLRFEQINSASPRYTGLHFFINMCWLTASYFIGIYKSINFSNSEKILTTYAKSLALFILLLFAYFISSRGYDFSRLQLGYTILIFGSVIFIARVFLILFVRRYRFMGYNYKTAIIIGDSLESFKVNHYLQSDKSMGYKFHGFFFDGTDKYQKYKKGGLSDVHKYCKDFGIDEVFYSLSAGNEKYLMELINYCDNNFIRLRLLPSLNILNGKQFNIEFYDRTPVLALRKEPLEDTFNRVLKRSFDLIFALFALFLLVPLLFPVVALLIKVTSPGPVFFKQLRSGRRNKFFYCYKFRTMRVNKDSDEVQAVKGDQRITSLGKFLRKSNIDELPQFFNVLIGNMSVVGPRPHMIKHTEQYSKLIEKYMVRHVVKPGITGLAQVNGLRGETTDAKKMKKRVTYDVWYIENWYFLLDIYIILKTLANVVRGEKNAV